MRALPTQVGASTQLRIRSFGESRRSALRQNQPGLQRKQTETAAKKNKFTDFESSFEVSLDRKEPHQRRASAMMLTIKAPTEATAATTAAITIVRC